jgi:mRNA interferase MazF
MTDWPRRGEVWWVDFDPSIGGEIQKTRPAVVVSNDVANRVLNRFQVVPLTSSIERVYAGNALVTVAGRTSKAVADQLFTAARQRFGRQLGRLSEDDLFAVEDAIRLQLAL